MASALQQTLLWPNDPSRQPPDPYAAYVVFHAPMTSSFSDLKGATLVTLSGVPSISAVYPNPLGGLSGRLDSAAIQYTNAPISFSPQAFCLEYYVYYTTVGGGATLVSGFSSEFNNLPAGGFYSYSYNNTIMGVYGNARVLGALSINHWHHIALTGTVVGSTVTFTIYVDGVSINTGTCAAYTTLPTFCFGDVLPIGGYVFGGAFCEARLTLGVPRYTSAFTPQFPYPL